jgi:cytochrome c553
LIFHVSRKNRSHHYLFTYRFFCLLYFICETFPYRRQQAYEASLFRQHCAVCHGPEGEGKTLDDGRVVPSLRTGEFKFKTEDEIYNQIANGGNGMTPFHDQLTERELRMMSTFVHDQLRKPMRVWPEKPGLQTLFLWLNCAYESPDHGCNWPDRKALQKSFKEKGYELLLASRKEPKGPDQIQWDPESGFSEPEKLEGLDAVVHLAGENISALRGRMRKRERSGTAAFMVPKCRCRSL